MNQEEHQRPLYKWDIQMIKDLIDPTDRVRMIGRSTILAEAIIQLAKENPEERIRIRDHYCSENNEHRADEHLSSMIAKEIFLLNKELASKFNRSRFEIIKRYDKYYLAFSHLPEQLIYKK